MQRSRRKESERRLRLTLYGLAFLVILIDQVSKAVAIHFFASQELHSVPVIPHIFHLTFVRNPGIAFGLFQGSGTLVTGVIFICVLLLLGVSLKLHTAAKGYQWAYGLVMGGALSNFIDRVRFGYVVDFLDFQIWPVFNIADSCITVGIAVLMFFTFVEN